MTVAAAADPRQLDTVDADYAEDSWAWKEDQFRTFDEHDPDDPVKAFPTEKPYLRAIHDVWQTFKFTLTEKSRQMMQSWAAVGDHLHLCQFTPRRRVLLNSMDEDYALALLDRMWFVYEQQDPWLKERHPAKQVGNEIIWENGSVASALTRGKHKSRSLVCSAFLFDEMAFHEHAQALFGAAIPGLVGDGRRGGRLTGISSAAPSFFGEIVKSVKSTAGEPIDLMPGLDVWRGREVEFQDIKLPAFNVVRLHYSADPDPYVQAKIAMARAHYESTGTLPWFMREYEIEYDSLAGEKIWPQLDKSIHGITPFSIPDDWKRVMLIDPGWRNFCAVLWVAVSPPGWRGCVDEDGRPLPVLVIYREMQVKKKTPREILRMARERSVGETFGTTLIDPSSDIHKGNEEAGLSTYEQFKELGIKNLIKANNAVEAGLNEVRRRLCVYGKSPALLIFTNLEQTWRYCGEYRYKDESESFLANNDPREVVRKKDDHIPDLVRYVCQFRPLPKKDAPFRAPPGSWAAVHRELKRKRRQKLLNSFGANTFATAFRTRRGALALR